MRVRDTVGHTVLATADSDVFASLRKRPTSRAERYAMGRALRHEVPRSSLGTWAPFPGRPDPVQLIALAMSHLHFALAAWARLTLGRRIANDPGVPS